MDFGLLDEHAGLQQAVRAIARTMGLCTCYGEAVPGNNASTADEVSEHSVLGLIWHRGSTRRPCRLPVDYCITR